MIGGLVLAAGGATRFGSAKQLADLQGRPLLEHALLTMSLAPVDRAVVVLGAEAEEVVRTVDLHGIRPVVCERWQEGQSASLACGLAALSDCDAVVVTLGRSAATLAGGDQAGRERPRRAAAVRATYGGDPGHPVVLERDLFVRLRDVTGDHGARNLLRSITSLERGLRRPRRWRGRGHAGAAGRTPSRVPPGVRSGGMKLEQSFEVAAPLERVWEALIDVRRVAPCLPGAEIEPGLGRRRHLPRQLHREARAHHRVLPGPAADGGGGRGRAARGDARERPGQARPGHREGEHRERDELQGDSTKRGRGDRLHAHWAAGPLRARRDDPGRLEPPAARLRELLAELDRVGAAERSASPAAGEAVSCAGTRRRPFREAGERLSRSSSAR